MRWVRWDGWGWDGCVWAGEHRCVGGWLEGFLFLRVRRGREGRGVMMVLVEREVLEGFKSMGGCC